MRTYVSLLVRVSLSFTVLIPGLAARAQADEIWVTPTYQADLGGVGIGSNLFWPSTAVGAVRLAWAVPDNLQAFQSAKVVLIPHSPGGAANLNLFICRAQHSDLAGAACTGPIAHGFTGVGNQLTEVDVSAAVGAQVGVAGLNYLAVLAFTAPTTATDHIVGLRFGYSPTVPAGVATLGANTFNGTQTAPAFVGSGAGLTDLPALAANSVGTNEVINDSLTAGDLAPGSVTASEILDGAVGTTDINSAQVQRRVSGSCGIGNAIRVVNADGTVACQSTGPASIARSVNLPITGFVNSSASAPIDFVSTNDTAPDFASDGRALFLEWDVDGSFIIDFQFVAVSLVVPSDYVAGGLVRLTSRVGANRNNDWVGQTTRQRSGSFEDTVASAMTGGTNCDASLTPNGIYICTLAITDGLAAGDALTIEVARDGGTDPVRLYAVEFSYTAIQ